MACAIRVRAETGSVDHSVDREHHRIRAARCRLPAFCAAFDPLHRRSERHYAAGGFEIALQGQHQRVTIDDAGLLRQNGADT